MNDAITVLHVDDDAAFAEMVATYLERENDRIEVLTKTDPEVGLEALDDRDIDCVVSDYEMPNTNGIDLLETVRTDHPELPFILFTGKGSEAVAGEAISKGVTDYLQKDSTTSQYAVLAHEIRNAVQQYRARRAVEETEEKLSQLAENANDILFMFNGDWSELLFINSAYEDIWGRPVEEVEADPHSFLDGVHPDDRERARESMEYIANGESITVEYRVIQPDGEQRWIHGDTKPIFDDDGTVSRIVGYVEDITDRKREVRKREQIIGRVTDGIIEVDTDWQFTLVNEAAEQLTDLNEEYLLGRAFWDVFDRAVGTRFEETYRNTMETREPTTFTEYFDQLDAWFDIDIYPQPDGGLAFYFRDVSDRIEHSLELERRAERFSYVEDVAEIGYWEIDAQASEPYPVTLSDGVYAIHDLSPDEPFDVERGLEFYPPDDRDLVRESVERAIAEGEPYDHETRLITAADRERWVHFVGEPVRENGEIIKIRGVFQDITDRKENELELARQNERLEAFASIVSHDLRSPLTVAEGHLELAQQEYESDHLREVDAAHDRMTAMIDDLLALARQGKTVTDQEQVALPEIVEEGWSNVASEETDLTLETDRTVLADRSRLLQVFVNLFSNAVTYGGSVVTVGECDDGIVVEDNGPGIPPDERESIFEAGYSTGDDGTGFGLSIVNEIVEAHGWTITVTTGSDGGARFEITGVEFIEE